MLSLQIKADFAVKHRQCKERPTGLHRWQRSVTRHKKQARLMASGSKGKLSEGTHLSQNDGKT